MKNLSKITIYTILIVLTFSSCAKQMSIMKRKYNKGYYVSHTSKKTDLKAQPTTVSIKQEKQIYTSLKPTQNISIPTITKNEEPYIAAAPIPKSTNIATKNEVIKTPKIITSNPFAKKTFKKLEQIKPVKAYLQKTKNNPDAGLVGAALSLFWIVILVILLLYLIGLLLNNFGLGWTIHILALVIVILLVLWLLRIV
jgi:hypothetical protein